MATSAATGVHASARPTAPAHVEAPAAPKPMTTAAPANAAMGTSASTRAVTP